MANAQQPTKRTRHMAIKTFALQEWCEREILILSKIDTKHNWADALTKAQSQQLFYRHMNHIMGMVIPKYSYDMLGISPNAGTISRSEHSYRRLSRSEHKIEGGCHNMDNIPT